MVTGWQPKQSQLTIKTARHGKEPTRRLPMPFLARTPSGTFLEATYFGEKKQNRGALSSVLDSL
jgi:hypothetical protein